MKSIKFIPLNKINSSKADYQKAHPQAKYSGKTIYDDEGKIIKKPGFYV